MIGAIVAKQQVNQAFSLLNQKRLDSFLSGWSDDALFHYPGQLTVSGTFAGREAIHSWFNVFFEQFSHIHFQLKHICVENLFDVVGNNNVIAYWDVALTNTQGLAVANTGTNLIKIRGRKVIEVRDFFFHQERLAQGWNEVHPLTNSPGSP